MPGCWLCFKWFCVHIATDLLHKNYLKKSSRNAPPRLKLGAKIASSRWTRKGKNKTVIFLHATLWSMMNANLNQQRYGPFMMMMGFSRWFKLHTPWLNVIFFSFYFNIFFLRNSIFKISSFVTKLKGKTQGLDKSKNASCWKQVKFASLLKSHKQKRGKRVNIKSGHKWQARQRDSW